MAEQTCELCGGDYHAQAETEGWQGLCCPGALASQQDRDSFIQALGVAYLEHLTQEAEDYANTVGERKRLWYQRQRTQVTQPELQADADTRVEQAKAAQPWLRVNSFTTDEKVASLLKADELDEGFAVDPPHLVVPDPKISKGLPKLTEEQKRSDYDAALYINDEKP